MQASCTWASARSARAHPAVATEAALHAGGELRWGIVGVSLRHADTRDALAPQDGLYTVALRDADGGVRRAGAAARHRRADASAGGARRPVRGARAHRACRHAHRQPHRHRKGLPPRPGERRAEPRRSRHPARHRARASTAHRDRLPGARPAPAHAARTRTAHAAVARQPAGQRPHAALAGAGVRRACRRRPARTGSSRAARSRIRWSTASCRARSDDDRERISQRLGLRDAWPVVAEPYLRLGHRRPLRRRPPRLGGRRRALRARSRAVRAAEAAHGQRQPLGARRISARWPGCRRSIRRSACARCGRFSTR